MDRLTEYLLSESKDLLENIRRYTLHLSLSNQHFYLVYANLS
jgi:hypothetical protein